MKPRDEWNLETHRLGRRVLIFDCVDSTNTLAASLAHDQANDGIVILADQQTAGRGQHGRSWQSEPGSSVLMSVLLFPPPQLRRPVILAAWAATAVCETIHQSTGLHATIKWPNDVLIRGRKVCGILIEQAKATVVGIGLNVNQSADSLIEAGLRQAGALAILAEKSLDRFELARVLIRLLDEEYERLCHGNLASLEARWESHTGLLGESVTVECHSATHSGRLRQLHWDGVRLQISTGNILILSPESIRHIVAI